MYDVIYFNAWSDIICTAAKLLHGSSAGIRDSSSSVGFFFFLQQNLFHFTHFFLKFSVWKLNASSFSSTVAASVAGEGGRGGGARLLSFDLLTLNFLSIHIMSRNSPPDHPVSKLRTCKPGHPPYLLSGRCLSSAAQQWPQQPTLLLNLPPSRRSAPDGARRRRGSWRADRSPSAPRDRTRSAEGSGLVSVKVQRVPKLNPNVGHRAVLSELRPNRWLDWLQSTAR